jgi:hypothetical protein
MKILERLFRKRDSEANAAVVDGTGLADTWWEYADIFTKERRLFHFSKEGVLLERETPTLPAGKERGIWKAHGRGVAFETRADFSTVPLLNCEGTITSDRMGGGVRRKADGSNGAWVAVRLRARAKADGRVEAELRELFAPAVSATYITRHDAIAALLQALSGATQEEKGIRNAFDIFRSIIFEPEDAVLNRFVDPGALGTALDGFLFSRLHPSARGDDSLPLYLVRKTGIGASISWEYGKTGIRNPHCVIVFRSGNAYYMTDSARRLGQTAGTV